MVLGRSRAGLVSVLAVVVLAVMATGMLGEGVAALPGGRTAVPTDGATALAEAQFAVEQGLGSAALKGADWQLHAAERQVVAGMKYFLVVDVTDATGTCERFDFHVWDRFGDQHLTHKASRGACT